MKQLEFPRAGTVVNDGFIGPAGMLTVDIDRWEFRLHDGETPGGHRILNLQQLLEIFMSKDSEFGSVVFAESDRGVLTRIGDRQYALRLLKGYGGIQVTEDSTHNVDNPNGEAADFWIGLDPSELATLLLGLASGKLLYAGLSTGTADALQLTVPTGWKNDQGSIVAFKSHVNVNDAATMQITVGSTAGDVLPIQTTSGSNKISQLIDHYSVCLLMRITDTDAGGADPVTAYRLINMVTAKELGIAAIAGMTSTNVQDALAELKGLIPGSGDPGDTVVNPMLFRRYANSHMSSRVVNMPLADGEFRFVSFRANLGGQGQSQFLINGQQVGSINGSQGQSTVGFWSGVVFRAGTVCFYSQTSGVITGPYPNAVSPGYIVPSTAINAGTVVGDVVSLECTNSGIPAYSDNGIIFPG